MELYDQVRLLRPGAQPPAVHSGWLLKNTGRWKRSKQRWFQLDWSFLSYSQFPNSVKRTKVAICDIASVQQHGGCNSGAYFLITATPKQWKLFPSSRSELELWKHAFQVVGLLVGSISLDMLRFAMRCSQLPDRATVLATFQLPESIGYALCESL